MKCARVLTSVGVGIWKGTGRGAIRFCSCISESILFGEAVW